MISDIVTKYLTESYKTVKDNDGHVYVIPASMMVKWNELMDIISTVKRGSKEELDVNAELDNTFHVYMR